MLQSLAQGTGLSGPTFQLFTAYFGGNEDFNDRYMTVVSVVLLGVVWDSMYSTMCFTTDVIFAIILITGVPRAGG